MRAKPDVIVTRGTPAALAARDAGSVPVVMAAAADPIGNKIVAALPRPGGHVTGLATIVNELHGKRLEVIRQVLPHAKQIAHFVNPSNPNSARQATEIAAKAHSLGFETKLYQAKDSETLQRALDATVRDGVGALLLSVEALIVANRALIIEFSAKHKLPVMYSTREFVDKGGFISYGVHYPDLYYRAAFFYVQKILKGANPGELPIEQPTKLELVINMKTAAALGIVVPRELLLRADEVIR